MPTEVKIAETDEGVLTLRGNELLLIDKTNGDPVAVRYRTSNEGKGKICADKFVEGAWRELGYFAVKEDERGRTDPTHANTAEWEFWGHKPSNNWNDQDYERLFAIRHDGVVFFKGSASPTPDMLISGNGKFALVQQSDGNSVCYRRDSITGALGEPVWASGFVEP